MDFLQIPELRYILIGLVGIALLIFLDVITAIAAAIRRNEFIWGEITTFLWTNVLPYLVAWSGLAVVPVALKYVEFPNEVVLPLEGLAVLTYAAVVGQLVRSIYLNLKDIGLPVEDGPAEEI